MSDPLQIVEDEAAKISKAPRITKRFIEDQIAGICYVRGGDMITFGALAPNNHDPDEGFNENVQGLTVCLLQVKNGFTVIGKSAPLSLENFNEEYGRQRAYEDAFRQLWPLYAFSELEDRERHIGPIEVIGAEVDSIKKTLGD